MDKDAALTRVLRTNFLPTLVGGEPLVNVLDGNRYTVQPSAEAPGAESLDQRVQAALRGEGKPVVLMGGEGSGKSTVMEKLVVDWARGQGGLPNISYVFYFGAREVDALKGPLSLEDLVMQRGQIPRGSLDLLLQHPEEVLFVLDDLDRCELSLDPSVHSLCSDPGRAVSPSCLMSSLLQGSLLPGAALLVSSRPSGRLQYLRGTVVDVLGFLKPQREAYVGSFFTDSAAADTALMHLERTLGFYEFCRSPRLCWSVCSIYKILMEAGADLPETFSQLCVDILVHLLKVSSTSKADNRELVLALGRMASHCSLHQHSTCTKEELRSFGLQPFLSSVGAFLQVDGDLDSDTCMFSLASQLMQEFLWAVSLFLDSSPSKDVVKVLEEHGGRTKFLDLFLSGLSEPGQQQQAALEDLLGPMDSDQMRDFRRWFKSSQGEVLKGFYKDKHLRCFQMLHQAQSESLVKEVVTPSTRTGLSYGDLSLQDCVALNYVVSSLGQMELLNLYRTRDLTEEKARVLTPAMSLSHQILLMDSSLTSGAVHHLTAALSGGGVTKTLDLSHTRLGDEKLQVLCSGLRSCRLLNIKLKSCSLSEVSCEALASALTSGSSQLIGLELMFNHIGDGGLVKLCRALQSPQCKLQELQLQSCDVTARSMEAFSAALSSGNSQLRSVNLTQNGIGDAGVEALCKSLEHPRCQLHRLNLFDTQLTGSCCSPLASALSSAHCSLLELDLSVNELGQEGALLLCQALDRPGCPVEKLGLTRCELTRAVFEKLGSLLTSGTSPLKSLQVALNNVGDEGVKYLLDALAQANCRLEELDVEMTDLTDACLEDLTSALRTSRTLRSLELRNNSLTDAAVPALVQAVEDSENLLEINLKYNDFSEDVFDLLDSCSKIRY